MQFTVPLHSKVVTDISLLKSLGREGLENAYRVTTEKQKILTHTWVDYQSVTL